MNHQSESASGALPSEHSGSPGPSARPRRQIVVVGAGPVGLTLSIDLAMQGVPVTVLDDHDGTLVAGSRAICFAKRTLEIWDRLGCGQRMVDRGVSWNIGKVFFQHELVYTFNLLPEHGHQRPAFINLGQDECEHYLRERAAELPDLDLRWKNEVVGIVSNEDAVELTVKADDGEYRMLADYLVACDGARSPTRQMLGLESTGRSFRDRFLIVDVAMRADFPPERWFWFDPPFHPKQSTLLHMQPDNCWRIDFQLGHDADPNEEKKPERVLPRVRALLGDGVDFELKWVSVYSFACKRMEKFRHGRVLFAGDAAHAVSPFGARGANSGVQDADNLAWKLRWVLAGKAPERLLDSYCGEREYAADENILHSTRATDFITPKGDASRLFRDAVLRLSKDHKFARGMVNSGRLSVPTVLRGTPLNTSDDAPFADGMAPGTPVSDAPVMVQGEPGWFLPHTGGAFVGIYFTDGTGLHREAARALEGLQSGRFAVRVLTVVPAGRGGSVARGFTEIEDTEGLLSQRFDACWGSFYLLRPDQHVCARFRRLCSSRVEAALERATCND